MKRFLTKIGTGAMALCMTAGTVLGAGMPLVANAEEEKVHITYSAWGGTEEKATEEAIVAAFEEEYPNIEVELIFPEGSYEEKLQVMIAGDEAPDVMSIGSAHIPNFAPAFAALDESLGADANYLSQDLVDALVYDGVQYALPKRGNAKVFAYNKDILDEAGVEIPGDDYTIDQFLEDAQKIAALDDDTYGVVSLVFTQWVYQFGGKMIDDDGTILFNSEEGIEAAQFIVDAINTYEIAPNAAVTEGMSEMQLFVSGEAGFKGDLGPFNLPDLADITTFDWDICAAPGQGGESEIVGLAMSATTEYPEEAQQFIEYVSTSATAQEIIGGTSAMPVTEEGKVAFLDQYPDKNLEAFFDAFLYDTAPAQVKGYNQIGGIVNDALNDRTEIGITGHEDVETVLNEAAAEAQEVIDEERE